MFERCSIVGKTSGKTSGLFLTESITCKCWSKDTLLSVKLILSMRQSNNKHNLYTNYGARFTYKLVMERDPPFLFTDILSTYTLRKQKFFKI